MNNKRYSYVTLEFQVILTIQSRLKHLNDPNHKAYQRRVQNATGYIMEADEKCFISALDLSRLERMISELPPPGGQGGS